MTLPEYAFGAMNCSEKKKENYQRRKISQKKQKSGSTGSQIRKEKVSKSWRTKEIKIFQTP